MKLLPNNYHILKLFFFLTNCLLPAFLILGIGKFSHATHNSFNADPYKQPPSKTLKNSKKQKTYQQINQLNKRRYLTEANSLKENQKNKFKSNPRPLSKSFSIKQNNLKTNNHQIIKSFQPNRTRSRNFSNTNFVHKSSFNNKHAHSNNLSKSVNISFKTFKSFFAKSFRTDLKYKPNVSFTGKGGNKRFISRLGTLLPIYQTNNSLWYFNVFGMADTQKAFEGNFSLGYRKLHLTSITGGFISYDIRRTNFGNRVHQLTLGGE